MIKRFGQRVELTIKGKDGEVVMESDVSQGYGVGLRVDFDIHLIQGFGRGTIKLFNLSTEMIKEINNGERYITLRTQLHDVDDFVLVEDWYISNSLEEKKVPNSILTLYCFDKLRKNLLEKQVNIQIPKPSLENIIKLVVSSVGFSSSKVQFKHFPPNLIDHVPLKDVGIWDGSVEACLQHHAKKYSYDYYANQDSLIIMHRPTADTVKLTDLYKNDAEIILDSNNMRANPKLSPAQLLVSSNLDGNISPTSILDISQLITVTTDADETALQVADDFLNKTTLGFTKYQTITVQHRGSNYTNVWETRVTGVAPGNGITMPLTGFQASRM